MAKYCPSPPLERLEKAAQNLRPREREILVLSALEHLSNNEIAARLALTPEAAERLLARAICSLDRALERQRRPWWKFW